MKTTSWQILLKLYDKLLTLEKVQKTVTNGISKHLLRSKFEICFSRNVYRKGLSNRNFLKFKLIMEPIKRGLILMIWVGFFNRISIVWLGFLRISKVPLHLFLEFKKLTFKNIFEKFYKVWIFLFDLLVCSEQNSFRPNT